MMEKLKIRIERLFVIPFVLALCLNFSFGMNQTEESEQSKIKKYYKKDYNFTKVHMSSHVNTWAQILEHLKGKPGVHYLEIGVAEGSSSIWMLENILTAPTARMTGIDPFVGDRFNIFLDNLRLSGFTDKVTIKRGYSQYELRGLPILSFDVIYIDGSHSAPDVLLDVVLCWDLLKYGGIMILDDYPWQQEELPALERPMMAIDAFLEMFEGQYETLHHKWQVIIKKL
jgi:predicted O-methyltransferase YrrM